MKVRCVKFPGGLRLVCGYLILAPSAKRLWLKLKCVYPSCLHTHTVETPAYLMPFLSLVTASQPPWHWNLPTRTSGLTSGVWTMLRGSFMRPSHRWGITHCYSLSCNPSIACHLLFWFLCQEVWMVFSVFGYKWAVSSVSREISWMLFLFSLFPLSWQVRKLILHISTPTH